MEKEDLAKDFYGINQTRRLAVPSAEEELFCEQPVLNNHFVRLVDYMGGDEAVVRGATAGKGRELVGNLSNKELFDYMRTYNITEPFRFPEMKMHFKVPISVALFWVYQKNFRINEYSGRYSIMQEGVREYSLDEIKSLILVDNEELKEEKAKEILYAFQFVREGNRNAYDIMTSEGFVKELARIVTGLGNDTEFYLSVNVEDLLVASRTAKSNPFNPDIAATADVVEHLIKAVAPDTYESFHNHKESKLELKIDKELLEENPDGTFRYGESETKRLVVSEAEDKLFVPYKILDKGWVMPTDYMGSDASVVQAARVSYGKGTTKVRQDEILIRYLLRHQHTTPFEHVDVQFEMKTPVFVSPRQAGRHRTAVKGYIFDNVMLSEDFYFPPKEDLCSQSKTNRQGRGKELDGTIQEALLLYLKETVELQHLTRKHLSNLSIHDQSINLGDWAIYNHLGVGHYNWTVWKQDLHNIFHFLNLRVDAHAQKEIQITARAMAEFVKKVSPVAYHAFLDYKKNAINFSVQEQKLLAKMIQEGKTIVPFEYYEETGWVTKKKKKNLEAQELDEKIELLFGKK